MTPPNIQRFAPGSPYDGPINKGDRFVWEPSRPEFRSELVVTQVTAHMVRSRRATGGRSFWNPISLFRDSCVPA